MSTALKRGCTIKKISRPVNRFENSFENDQGECYFSNFNQLSNKDRRFGNASLWLNPPNNTWQRPAPGEAKILHWTKCIHNLYFDFVSRVLTVCLVDFRDLPHNNTRYMDSRAKRAHELTLLLCKPLLSCKWPDHAVVLDAACLHMAWLCWCLSHCSLAYGLTMLLC